ncbi:MAG: MaoC family dehydratase [Gemmatimonadetes bacterium]|nr:MaoC family dehydratase [Gemmatimonadota bacterium]
MIDRANIGRTFPPFEVEVDKSRLRLFAKAIGETRPVYLDEAAARAAGYRSLLAPPTFVNCLAADDPRGFQYLQDLGVPMARMLHAEQTFNYRGPLCAGDRVVVERRVADIYDKKGGALEFIRFELTVRNAADGTLIADCISLLAIRNEVAR